MAQTKSPLGRRVPKNFSLAPEVAYMLDHCRYIAGDVLEAALWSWFRRNEPYLAKQAKTMLKEAQKQRDEAGLT